ncbi:MAG TPA: MauE/DoxX family redox-associated membrane protein [Iamia sp.]|nr:MauE/DoxX family redox-associated membrane protein [Iamia sp.]
MNGALATAVQLAAAGTLLVAAAAKAAAPGRVATTISAIGLRPAAALHAVLVTAEAGAALALVLAPGALATRALVLALGLSFAGAGLVAHRRGTSITCACFGGRDGRPLGLRQVVALPGWVVAALVPAASPLSGADGLLALTAVAAGSGVVLAAPVLGTVRRNGPLVAVRAS